MLTYKKKGSGRTCFPWHINNWEDGFTISQGSVRVCRGGSWWQPSLFSSAWNHKFPFPNSNNCQKHAWKWCLQINTAVLEIIWAQWEWLLRTNPIHRQDNIRTGFNMNSFIHTGTTTTQQTSVELDLGKGLSEHNARAIHLSSLLQENHTTRNQTNPVIYKQKLSSTEFLWLILMFPVNVCWRLTKKRRIVE